MWVAGRQVTGPGPDRAFVFQNYALFPWLTVRENILYPMKQQGVPREEREERLRGLLAMAHLEGKEDLYPHQLSGGMKQRTAVIRALACRPEVMLMDEPLGALDFQMRKNMQEELEQIFLKDRVTVVMVTHDVEEAVYMSDRVIVFSARGGHITEDFAVSMPRPRVRASSQYQRSVAHLIEVLKQGSAEREMIVRSQAGTGL